MPESITLTNTALIKYTMFSLIFAAVILLTVILPAEYNIDPTGIGHKLGLTVFNKVKAENEISLSLQEISSTAIPSTPRNATETIEVIIPAGRGIEYKFNMQQYQKMEYEWITDGAPLYFDLHGEPEGDTTGYFESYAIATLDGMKGSFTAPFSGVHGWYWKNTTDVPVAVQLIVKGEYAKHGLK
ncbi:MAG: hypothetical protein HRT37_23020 [Alteromonadaceae bacterium]|nr:hypothetical protein [Alteromonadaceae bacterium]